MADDAVVIERTFDAPVHVVWRMWTEPEHFSAWYGPAGATVVVAEMDVRVGGRRRVAMEVRTPDGPMRLSFTGEYLEVVDDERLVYTDVMSAEHGAVPPPAGHTATEVRVELHALGDRTRVVLTHLGVPPGSPGAAGWEMALDQLAARL